jgi:hypothetical protein
MRRQRGLTDVRHQGGNSTVENGLENIVLPKLRVLPRPYPLRVGRVVASRVKFFSGSCPSKIHLGKVPFFRRDSYESSFLHLLIIVVSSTGAPIVQ